jgi:hypothetical protein
MLTASSSDTATILQYDAMLSTLLCFFLEIAGNPALSIISAPAGSFHSGIMSHFDRLSTLAMRRVVADLFLGTRIVPDTDPTWNPILGWSGSRAKVG